MKVLVTGGAGFIGSHLVDRLLAEGHLVEVVDDLSTGSMANLSQARAEYHGQIRISELDIRSDEFVQHVIKVEPEVVFHMAAQADVRVSIQDPLLDAEINILGTINVLEAARLASTRKIVFAASGGTLYGEPTLDKLPIKETEPQRPLSQYGVSKKVALDYMATYRQLYGLDYSALALANVYGPRQDPHGEAGVVAIFAGNLVSNIPCKIFGTGEQTRDFIFVDDVVDAFSKAASSGSGEVINIGTGIETSVNTLYSTVVRATKSKLEPNLFPARPGELDRSSLSPKKAKKVLNWTSWTSLEEGIAQVVQSLT